VRFVKKFLCVPLLATLALLTAAPHAAGAQWRATAWTMDIQNDTESCVAMFVGDEDAKLSIARADVTPHHGHHFDDSHTNVTIRVKVWEHPDCTGRFVAETHDDVYMNRNILTVAKVGSKYVIQRAKS
jgi:hypothetical protein